MTDFYAVLEQVVDLLRGPELVSYRALKRLFNRDDTYLDGLKEYRSHGLELPASRHL